MNKVFSLKIDYDQQKLFDTVNNVELQRFNISNTGTGMQILKDESGISYVRPTGNTQGIRIPNNSKYCNFGYNNWAYEINLRRIGNNSIYYGENAALFGVLFRNCSWLTLWGDYVAFGHAYTADTTNYSVYIDTIPNDGQFHSIIATCKNRTMSVYLDYQRKGSVSISDRPWQIPQGNYVGILNLYPDSGAEGIYDRTLRADVSKINIYSGEFIFKKFINNNLKVGD